MRGRIIPDWSDCSSGHWSGLDREKGRRWTRAAGAGLVVGEGGGAGLVAEGSMGAGYEGGGGGMVPSERRLVKSTRCWKVL